MLQLRYESYLLQESFKKDGCMASVTGVQGLRCDCAVCFEIFEDVDDPDRTDIPEVHIAFYFSKYFKRTLNPQVPPKLVKKKPCKCKIIAFAALNPL